MADRRPPQPSSHHDQEPRPRENHQQQHQQLRGVGVQFDGVDIGNTNIPQALEELPGNPLAASLQLRAVLGRTIATNTDRVALLDSNVVKSLSSKQHK
ncbi:hypothetical protein F4677DRAFT_428664 [Hypoxylon crocopeplum]|nr:hypothetical protein F4677DRAFT_428664 [Hypoxylon crocopeplum]